MQTTTEMIGTAAPSKAQTTIDELKQLYRLDSFSFSFYCSQRIAGDHNKETRREIIYLITGERRPLAKCGLTATEIVLAASFKQFKLF